MTITRTEIDGVPVVIAPGDGPLTAGLVFRVGRADEPTARAGLTRLAGRLAGGCDVGALTTTFRVRGDGAEVVADLDRVCRALADPPLDRLAEAREELLAAAWTSAPAETLAFRRYGARGHGLVGVPEYGLHVITADELRRWNARYFTRANAMLWITGGGPPDGLRLPLPDGGAREPVPEAVSVLAETPAYAAFAEVNTVALQSIVRGGPAASAFTRSLSRLLPAATVGCVPRDRDHATLTVLLDAPPGRRDSAIGALADAVAALRLGPIPPLTPTPDARDAAALVRDELLGHVPEDGPVDVARVAAQAWDSALLMVPSHHRTGRGPTWAGFAAPPGSDTAPPVEGRRFRMHGDREAILIIGAEGVTMELNGARATVRHTETVVMLAWPDGARRLFSPDVQVHIEPHVFTVNVAAMAAIDAAVPAELRVDMPARPPGEIPRRPGLFRRPQ
ncbi:hypothetical protein [Catenuloplanes atrovinosus]|uniref:Uncharacterized protein n=1 Tax=Catenuloplanes atrovinosus TaxID=137266 RepID=A0AAE3YQY7_9ACTN|nr:hypothetical protein [Catenuloplanes atrovinosus]MDR7277060.1 hypothetical protein [Catenuloplanes atrovinosus]